MAQPSYFILRPRVYCINTIITDLPSLAVQRNSVIVFISLISYDGDYDGLVGDVHGILLVPVDDVAVLIKLSAVLGGDKGV